MNPSGSRAEVALIGLALSELLPLAVAAQTNAGIASSLRSRSSQ